MASPTRRKHLAALTALALCAAANLAPAATLAQTDDEVDLLRAAQLDNVSGVTAALSRGANPNARDSSGETALIVAMRYEAYRVASVLMKHPRIDLEAQAPNGNTALMMAAFRGSKPAVLDMLAHGARVEQPGWTALHYAVAAGSTEVAALLLERHAHVDAEAPSGMTPLMLAAREGQEQAVLFLLEHGADASRKDGGFHLNAAEFAIKAEKPWIAKAINDYLARTARR
ncbi:ankyrin repeat domain-containing protein [Pseudoduganella danionis]|uniref:Ankyrin repeat domain-containing protein n=1 Tax=Pseudoduganella danionis TaxID=1890295 RepID=A0ABW9SSN8_9BURK|nr:ankyrin repeat domain-containing protein [Pseudoduganella danionis]MTW34611.1 ankyrin repeat domain-containing protein [Pseudoduganella danionis]